MHHHLLQLFIILHLLLGLVAQAGEIAPTTRLSELPNGTRIEIRRDLEVEGSGLNDPLYYHGHFDNHSYDPGADAADWDNSFDSGASIRAMYSGGVIFKFESSLIFDYERVTYLSHGTYCLSQRESTFRSDTNSGITPARDRLVFRDCRTKELTFLLFVTAGYGLRSNPDFQGLTVRDLYDQVGSAMKLALPH
jgi:hypothetical protein